jgi:hypothetical protein
MVNSIQLYALQELYFATYGDTYTLILQQESNPSFDPSWELRCSKL